MPFLRLLVLVFNVAIVTFLIYEMINVAKTPMEKTKKIVVLIGGCILLLAPFGMFLRFFGATPQYFIIYPIAISLFIYLTRKL